MHADNAKKNFFRPGGDHLTLLNVYKQWEETSYSVNWCYDNYVQLRSMRRAHDIKDQLRQLCERVEIFVDDPELSIYEDEMNTNIRKCITAGYFTNAAKYDFNGQYKTLKSPHTVKIHPHSLLFEYQPPFVIYNELVFTTKEYMRNVLEIEPEWLIEIAPHAYSEKDLKPDKKSLANQQANAQKRQLPSSNK